MLFASKHFAQAIIYAKCVDPISVMTKIEFAMLPSLYLFQCGWAIYGFSLYSYPNRILTKPECAKKRHVIELFQVARAGSIVANYYLLVLLIMIPMVIAVCFAVWYQRRREEPESEVVPESARNFLDSLPGAAELLNLTKRTFTEEEAQNTSRCAICLNDFVAND